MKICDVRGFTAGQQNCVGLRAAGPSRAVGRGPLGLRAAGPLGRGGPWAVAGRGPRAAGPRAAGPRACF